MMGTEKEELLLQINRFVVNLYVHDNEGTGRFDLCLKEVFKQSTYFVQCFDEPQLPWT